MNGITGNEIPAGFKYHHLPPEMNNKLDKKAFKPIDQEEKDLMKSIERDEWQPVENKRMHHVSHHMYLEAQDLTDHHSKEAFESMVEEILESPSKLWDKKFE